MSLRKNRQYKELEKLSRILHASFVCCTLDERDAVIDALRPLVEQGWQIDLTYSFVHQLTPRRVTLGARVDVFDQPPEQCRVNSHDTSTSRRVYTCRDDGRAARSR
jgi:hypothetical protein